MNTNPVILYSKRLDRDFNEILRYLNDISSRYYKHMG
jgi:hypothetical protein